MCDIDGDYQPQQLQLGFTFRAKVVDEKSSPGGHGKGINGQCHRFSGDGPFMFKKKIVDGQCQKL